MKTATQAAMPFLYIRELLKFGFQRAPFVIRHDCLRPHEVRGYRSTEGGFFRSASSESIRRCGRQIPQTLSAGWELPFFTAQNDFRFRGKNSLRIFLQRVSPTLRNRRGILRTLQVIRIRLPLKAFATKSNGKRAAEASLRGCVDLVDSPAIFKNGDPCPLFSASV